MIFKRQVSYAARTVSQLCFPLFLAKTIFAQPAVASILPPNNLHLRDNIHTLANLSEEEFNSIVTKIVDYYRPIVLSHGGTLIANNLWTDGTVNASAIQRGRDWIINMYGGLARRPEVTPDGFALVVCHELGHHLGGFPFNGDNHWAASEGQADYFATQSCAREIWRTETLANSHYRTLVGAYEKGKCDEVWSQVPEQDLCYRIAAAGKSVAALFSALGSGKQFPRFETPDPKVVTATFTRHPEAQCRLDTYFNGALCTAHLNTAIIPARNPNGGQSSLDSELKTASSSCLTSSGYVEGVRPLCWFKPQQEFLPIQLSEVLFNEKTGHINQTIEPGERIEALFSLSNRSEAPTTHIHGVLSSKDNRIEIIEAKVQFQDITAGGIAHSDTPFIFKIADSARCGDIIPLTMRARSDQGSMEIKREITLGRTTAEVLGSLNPDLEIPDEDIDGIESKFISSIDGTASVIAVQLDIDHPSIRELRVSLYSPDGKQFRIFPTSNHFNAKPSNHPNERYHSGIHQQIKIDSRFEKLSGIWRLTVKDIDESNVGKIKSWSITALKEICE